MASLSPRSVMVTGANRGIGLAFVRQLLALPTPPAHVFATYRSEDKAKDLLTLAEKHKNLHPIKMELTGYKSFDAIVSSVEKTLGKDGLNLLINNAGLMKKEPTSAEVTPENMRESYEINTIAPLMLAKAFIPLLLKAKSSSKAEGMSCSKAAIINISTMLASIKDNGMGGYTSYRASKAGLNMMNKNLSLELAPQGVLAAVLHPGWVQTDLGGPKAPTTPEESVRGMLSVMGGLDADKTGTFWDFRNKELPW